MRLSTQHKNRLMHWASVASVGTAACLIMVKLFAFSATHSMAIFAGMFDSTQDILTSLISFFAIRQATTPADKKHRFGHGKAQAIGGLIQTIIIAIAALFLISEAIQNLIHPSHIKNINVGIWITLFSLAMTIALVTFQKYVIRKTNSLSIQADSAHYTGDILMNIGVLISIAATAWLKITWIDAAFGVGVGLWLLFSVYNVMRDALAMLMDTEMPKSFRQKIREIVLDFSDVKTVTHLKTRMSGSIIFIQFNIKLNGDISLNQAHALIDKIETAIQSAHPDSEIIIHPEPFMKHLDFEKTRR